MRQQVSLMVRKELTERARDFNIIMDDVAITELAFGKEYTAAVESKQVCHSDVLCNGACHLVVIVGSTLLIPYKSLQFIWRLGALDEI